ncbi:MAG: hypothetical protein GEU76_13130 [Alphaproteobacteria bacterium]|jgi:hypothetical protein|nr:hypothetical protein [Alphaproteobacteria bacterium]
MARLSPNQTETWKSRTIKILRKAYRWGQEKIPRGLRLVVGLLLIAGGIFGFLPILGFWMVPVGAVFVALDIPPLRRWLDKKLGSAAAQ